MTEYEIIQNYYACADLMASYVINFMSILSGYLLATYFLGKKITGVQFLILTLSYLFVMVVTIFAIYMRIKETFYLAAQLDGLESAPIYVADSVAAFFILSAHVLILLGSIYFSVMSSFGKKLPVADSRV